MLLRIEGLIVIVLVNSTKNTLKGFKISIAWNNEEGFEKINQIIQLFRWMKLNIVFEPVDIAGQNYQKNIKYGLDEPTLTHIKKTNLLIHTAFDYQYFNSSQHKNAEYYLNTAMKNYFIKYYFDDKMLIKDTMFFEKNRDYIKNISDFYKLNIEQNNYTKLDNKTLIENADFYYSYGENFAIFSLNKLNSDDVLKRFIIELLRYLKLEDKAEFLLKFKNIPEAIKELRQNVDIVFTPIEEIKNIKIEWNDIQGKIPSFLDNEITQLNGIYKVCDIVEAIKDKKTKLLDEYELHLIFANDIEVYPNINFWEDVVINPVIKLQKIDINKVTIIG